MDSNVVGFPVQAAVELAKRRAVRLAALSPQERADLEDFRRLPLEEQQRQLQLLRGERERRIQAANRALQTAMADEPATIDPQKIVEGLAAWRGILTPKILRAMSDVHGRVRYDDAQREGGDGDDPTPLHTTQAFKPRKALLLSTWLTRELPERDWIFAGMLCTTSRWIIFGDTGVGKTLIALDIAGAAAAGSHFLSWLGSGKRIRVMYFDGEMPAETAKERLQIIGQRYGEDLDLWFYNRDVLKDGEMPPLNSEEGEKWLLKEIEAVKPNLIIFDNIMSLLQGSMSDPESWQPIILLMRKLSSERIAQIWVHHTGHDNTRGYGDKTREWQVDTVMRLIADADENVTLDFTKSRLKTPKTKDLYKPLSITCGPDGWEVVGETISPGKKGKDTPEIAKMKHAILDAYDRLADYVEETSPGFDGAPVRKVKAKDIQDSVRDRGFIDVKETGGMEPTSKMMFLRSISTSHRLY
jgi:hypothetical protein